VSFANFVRPTCSIPSPDVSESYCALEQVNIGRADGLLLASLSDWLRALVHYLAMMVGLRFVITINF